MVNAQSTRCGTSAGSRIGARFRILGAGETFRLSFSERSVSLDQVIDRFRIGPIAADILILRGTKVDESADTARMEHIELAVDIVAAYVSNNSVPPGELPALINGVHAALNSLSAAHEPAPATVEKLSPAQIRKSIAHDHLVSFEDGKSYKTLRRHLTLRGLTPDAYREKWGLPRDYPMTAASYSAQRSELARALGLGQQRRKRDTAAAESAPPAAPKARGRKKAAPTE